jgi:hypothetical protein
MPGTSADNASMASTGMYSNFMKGIWWVSRQSTQACQLRAATRASFFDSAAALC